MRDCDNERDKVKAEISKIVHDIFALGGGIDVIDATALVSKYIIDALKDVAAQKLQTMVLPMGDEPGYTDLENEVAALMIANVGLRLKLEVEKD